MLVFYNTYDYKKFADARIVSLHEIYLTQVNKLLSRKIFDNNLFIGVAEYKMMYIFYERR